jgi:hypothetical protein
MPWNDVTTRPTEDEVYKFIDEQDAYENAGPVTKAARWAATPLAKAGSMLLDPIGEGLMKYGEGEGLNLGRYHAAKLKPGESAGLGRKAATYGGAFAQSLGEELDSFASPMGIATMAAGPLGRGAQALSGLKPLAGTAVGSVVGRAGTAATYAPKAIGYGMMGHAGIGAYNAVTDPSEAGTLEDLKGPAIEGLMGYLGARQSRTSFKPKTAAAPPSGPITSEGLAQSRFGEAPQRGVNPEAMFGRWDKPAASARPGIDDWVDEFQSQPTRPPASVVDLPRWGLTPEAQVGTRGTGAPPASEIPPEYSGYNEPGYIQEIKARFDKAMGGSNRATGGSGESPYTNQRMAERQAGYAEDRVSRSQAELAKTEKLQAEIDAENKAAGFKVKGRVAKTVPDEATIVAEDLRRPYSENRAKYPKGVINQIDIETLKNSKLAAALSKGELADLRASVMKNPSLRSLLTSDIGEANYDNLVEKLGELGEGFGKGVQKVKGKVAAARQNALTGIADAEATGVFGKGTTAVEAARKAAAALTGPDVTGIGKGFSSFLKSGWAHLEAMGEPGVKLSRLLQRERIDTGIEQAAAEKAGKVLTDAEGKPINRTGGLIRQRHKDTIDSLIKQIADPEDQKNAKALVDVFSGANKADDSFNSGVEKWKALQGLTKLSQFGIGNVAGSVPVAMRNRLGTTLRAARKVLPGSAKFEEALALAKESGQLGEKFSPLMKDSGEGGVSKLVDKLFRISGSEKRMRTMATLAGRDTAQELFTKLKANPTSKSLMKQLDDLLLEDDMGSVLKQGKLTDLQIKRAGGRMNELTQGLAEGIDLPPQWKNYDLATQFKKFSFMQTRNMTKAAKANLPRAAGAVLLGAPLLGEATGDVKAAIKGGVKHAVGAVTGDNKDDSTFLGDIGKEIGDRGAGLGRYGQNLNQAWALGILGDVAKGVERGPMGLAEVLGGPTIGDISEAAYGGYQLYDKGQGYHLGRQAARMVPFIGTGLAGSIKGSYVGKQKKRRKEKKGKR